MLGVGIAIAHGKRPKDGRSGPTAPAATGIIVNLGQSAAPLTRIFPNGRLA